MNKAFERFQQRREKQIEKLEGNRDLLITGVKAKTSNDEEEKTKLIEDFDETIGHLQIQEPDKILHSKKTSDEIVEELVEVFFHWLNMQKAIDEGPYRNEWVCKFTGINCYRSKKTRYIERKIKDGVVDCYNLLAQYIDRPWAYLVAEADKDNPLTLEEIRFFVPREHM